MEGQSMQIVCANQWVPKCSVHRWTCAFGSETRTMDITWQNMDNPRVLATDQRVYVLSGERRGQETSGKVTTHAPTDIYMKKVCVCKRRKWAWTKQTKPKPIQRSDYGHGQKKRENKLLDSELGWIIHMTKTVKIRASNNKSTFPFFSLSWPPIFNMFLPLEIWANLSPPPFSFSSYLEWPSGDALNWFHYIYREREHLYMCIVPPLHAIL